MLLVRDWQSASHGSRGGHVAAAGLQGGVDLGRGVGLPPEPARRPGADRRQAPHSAHLHVLHDLGHRLRAPLRPQEGDQRQVPREVPARATHAQQAAQVGVLKRIRKMLQLTS